MRSNQIWRTRFVFPALVVTALVLLVAIFVLAVNENEGHITESASTLETQAQAPLNTSTAVAEPTAEEAKNESTEETVPEDESAPTQAPLTGASQMEEYVSVTEFFNVMVPAGWRCEETFPGGALVIANSEAALERFGDDAALESGDLILNVGFLPFELFRQREVVPLNIQFEATPDVFMQSVLPVFRASGNAVLSDVERVSISAERDAGMISVSDKRHEGLILMYVAGDEVVTVVSAVGFPGEIDAFRETILAIAGEVTYSGAQDALYGALLEG